MPLKPGIKRQISDVERQSIATPLVPLLEADGPSAPMLTGFFYRHFGSVLNAQGLSETQFYFSNIFVAAVLPASLAGYLNSKYRHSSALWVWTVPTLILLASLLAFRSSTVFANRWSETFAYYFSSNWSVPRSAQDAFSRDLSGMRVFIAQADVSAPFYAGIAYSLGARQESTESYSESVIPPRTRAK